MKINHIKKTNLIIFKYLWLIILLPKEIQFFVYLGIILLLLVRNRIIVDKITMLFFLAILVQFLAIIYQFTQTQFDLIRTLAAFNTLLIWLIAVLYYSYFKMGSMKTDVNRLAKYMFINVVILLLIYLLYLSISTSEIHIFGYTWYLRREDYLLTGNTTRFSGLMETVLGPSHLFLFAFPISLIYVKNFKYNIIKYIYILISYIAIFSTHSRIGIVICFLVSVLGIIYIYLSKRKTNIHKELKIYKVMKFFLFFLFIVVFVVALLNFNIILEYLNQFWSLREGSNNARFDIYSRSILKTLNESPLIGIGIKYMIGDFPYGSHSTYIGLFYKSGIIGFILFTSAILLIYKKLWINSRKTPHSKVLFFMLLLYLGLLVFADIDASNWTIVSWFSIWGILSNRKNIMCEGTNDENFNN